LKRYVSENKSWIQKSFSFVRLTHFELIRKRTRPRLVCSQFSML
jgi:hypothetical protein